MIARTVLLWAVLVAPLAASGKSIDLRARTDADGLVREISYCARPSPDGPKHLPGHAYLVFGVEGGGRFRFRAIGHTTSDVGPAIVSFTGLLKAQGAVVDEVYTAAKQMCLTTRVNRDAFEAAYSDAGNPLAALGFDRDAPYVLAYSLGAEDCVGFMLRVARRFQANGLKVPARQALELPLAYLRRLVDAN